MLFVSLTKTGVQHEKKTLMPLLKPKKCQKTTNAKRRPRSVQRYEPFCFFCNIAFTSELDAQAHMAQKHMQCSKCNFWIESELYIYDHTCVPRRHENPLEIDQIVSMGDDQKETQEEKEAKTKSFRLMKCEAHQNPTSLAIIRRCINCQMRVYGN